MSMVGPRPLPAGQVEANAELLDRRHDLPTGLTGWWQVNGRSDVDADHAIDMDMFYVENWSFAFDMYILVKTVRAVLSKTGAY
jgi:lipopolysaccharide/colanic/teichoic acid biosynthesis glycosyltransferase